MKKIDKTLPRRPDISPVLRVVNELAAKLQAVEDDRKDLLQKLESQLRQGHFTDGIIMLLRQHCAHAVTLKGQIKTALQNALDQHLRAILAQTKEEPPAEPQPRRKVFTSVSADLTRGTKRP